MKTLRTGINGFGRIGRLLLRAAIERGGGGASSQSQSGVGPHLGGPHLGGPHLGGPNLGGPNRGGPHSKGPHRGGAPRNRPDSGGPNLGGAPRNGLSEDRAGARQTSPGPIKIAAVNGRCSAEQAAHLLKYDSVHGTWDKEVSFSKNALFADGRKIPYTQHEDPADIPWEENGVNTVAECSGAFKTREKSARHLSPPGKKNSVQKVIVAAPASGADLTVVFGVNHRRYDKSKHHIISLSSCTTNCAAPVLAVLSRRFGLEKVFMTTIHAYTNDQRLLDGSHKGDFRRARAAALNMIPTSTGASKAAEQILPELKGKIKGVAVRVPTADVSLLDLSAETSRPLKEKELAAAFREAAGADLERILAVEEAPLVSADFTGRTESAIIDAPFLQVLQNRFVKILAWYDNEAGFTVRLIDFMQFMEEQN